MGVPNVTCFSLCCKPPGSDLWSHSLLPVCRHTTCLVCCVHLQALSRLVVSCVKSCRRPRSVAMARPPLWLLLLLFCQCVLPSLAMGKRDEYRGGKGGASYKSWEGWNQRGYWGGRSEPKELVVRVETDQFGAKKGRKKDKKKRARSSSSSSSSSTSSSCRKHKGRKSSKKKERKDKKDSRKDSAPVLSSAELEELRAFRRQAELDKVRQEVLSSLDSGTRGTGAPSRPEEAAVSTISLTPKSKKCMLAQTRVLGDSGSVVALVSSDVQGWDQVHEQLESHPPPLVKKLLGQLQGGDAPIPRLKADAVKQIIALLQGD